MKAKYFWIAYAILCVAVFVGLVLIDQKYNPVLFDKFREMLEINGLGLLS